MKSKIIGFILAIVFLAVLVFSYYSISHNGSFSGLRKLFNIEPDLNAISQKCNIPITHSYALNGAEAIVKVGSNDDFRNAADCVVDEFPSSEKNKRKIDKIVDEGYNPLSISGGERIMIAGKTTCVLIFPSMYGNVMVVGDVDDLYHTDLRSLTTGLMRDISSGANNQ